jgi:2-haloacid dehalogenase
MPPRYQAVLFDLLTALLDSWSLFNAVAGDEERGLAWRKAYLRRTYAAGAYVPFERLVRDSAHDVALPDTMAAQLLRRWDELQAWPEAAEVLRRLSRSVRLGVVTNCSEKLGARAAARVGVPFAALVTAERAGFYKPELRTYQLALEEIGAPPGRTLFVAGSPGDVQGAASAGMDVYWHNRRRLPLARGAPSPLAQRRTLRPLLRFVHA